MSYLDVLMDAYHKSNLINIEFAIKLPHGMYKCYKDSINSRKYLRTYAYDVMGSRYYFDELMLIKDNKYKYKDGTVIYLYLYLASPGSYESMYSTLDESNINIIPFTSANLLKLLWLRS